MHSAHSNEEALATASITMGMNRITLPFPLFVAGSIALFAAGVNLSLLSLVLTGRLTCKVHTDPSLHAINAMPSAWCPAHGGKSYVKDTLKQHVSGQLVIDVGAYDGSGVCGNHVRIPMYFMFPINRSRYARPLAIIHVRARDYALTFPFLV